MDWIECRAWIVKIPRPHLIKLSLENQKDFRLVTRNTFQTVFDPSHDTASR